MSQMKDRLDEILLCNVGGKPPSTSLRAAAVVVVKDGEIVYSNATGKLNDTEDSPPLTMDSVGRIASVTKIITSVGAMQLVERGLVGLDDDVGKYVPYLADVKVLKGFDSNGSAILEPRQNPITLRTLLTHTAGFTYETFDPQILQWCASIGRVPTDGYTLDSLKIPLTFEPGTTWMYGKGIDWAGQVIEAISGLSLEEYMKKNIFEPLDMRSSTFMIKSREDLSSRRIDIQRRDIPGHPLPTGEPSADEIEDPEIAVGGSGLFSSPRDLGKFFEALINKDGKLLSRETFSLLAEPQLSAEVAQGLQAFCDMPRLSPVPDCRREDGNSPLLINHCLGGAVNINDVPNKRMKGSLTWRGMTNSYWFVDPQSGIAALVFVQVVPYGDPAVIKLGDEIEEEIYRSV